ncbi:MAG: chemotaxis-specific protein-glutamate methyltransferase CheB [Alphaproteobacteria bacterium]|nr:chemotaxis-specific protein-glutamate methyltransferase CheB [Alphaproteobacteria bacterium]
MVVDDSAVIRGFFRRALESDPMIEVVASVGNGQNAIDSLRRTPVDVVVLDIEMPVMDGMTALPKLLEIDPAVKIVMASTLTLSNADTSFKALARGAADYIPKPTTTQEIHSGVDFQRELVEKVKALGFARRGQAGSPATARLAAATQAATSAKIVLRQPGTLPPTVLAIVSSTGGPQALMAVIGALGKDFPLPIFVTQHMPATFTGILADHIGKAAGRDTHEAVTGEPVKPGTIYVAPGDYHMVVEKGSPANVIRLNQDSPENFCRPSADPMLRSLAAVYGNRLLCVILTGMGHDGLAGSRVLVDAGGTLIAQDEASSVVWGMPGSVANAGLCSDVLPLGQVAGRVLKLCGRPAS